MFDTSSDPFFGRYRRGRVWKGQSHGLHGVEWSEESVWNRVLSAALAACSSETERQSVIRCRDHSIKDDAKPAAAPLAPQVHPSITYSIGRANSDTMDDGAIAGTHVVRVGAGGEWLAICIHLIGGSFHHFFTSHYYTTKWRRPVQRHDNIDLSILAGVVLGHAFAL